jgi:hypothetical protein
MTASEQTNDLCLMWLGNDELSHTDSLVGGNF